VLKRGNLRGSGASLPEIAARQDDLGSLAREFQRGFITDAAVAARYDDRLAGKIRYVIGGPRFLGQASTSVPPSLA